MDQKEHASKFSRHPSQELRNFFLILYALIHYFYYIFHDFYKFRSIFRLYIFLITL